MCSSFNILRIRSKTSSRTKAIPWSEELFAGEAGGNCLLRNCILILAACNDMIIFLSTENFQSSKIWDIPKIQKLTFQKNAEVALIDQCCYGLSDPVPRKLYRKRTKFLGTVPGRASVSRPCPGNHEHQHVGSSIFFEGRSVERSILAGRYPEKLCDQISSLVQLAQAESRSSHCGRAFGGRC